MKKEARRRLQGNWGNCIALTVMFFAFLGFLVMCEILIFLTCRYIGKEYSYTLDFALHSRLGIIMFAVRLAVVFVVVMPEMFFVRRLFIDISEGKSYSESRQYIQSNIGKLFPKVFGTVFITSMLKFFAAVPLGIGAYGIYYWGWVCKLDELTLFGLFIFMLSLGFTVVWTGVFIHYCISLSLTGFIMVLNPRANVFDACDLSVRLMEGRHGRYISFMLSFVKFIPLCPFVFPVFAVLPYFMLSYVVFIEDIMGDYWQDKLPSMIQRWKKHVR